MQRACVRNATDLILLICLAIITIYPLFAGKYTTHDDVDLALTVWNQLTWEYTKNQSIGQGRLTFLWGFPIASIPYIYDHFLWYSLTKYGSILLMLFAMWFAIVKIFESKEIGLLAIVIYLSILQNGWEHNALTAYPFSFNIYMASLFLSFGLFSLGVKHNNTTLSGIASVFYLIALASELFVLFFPFYIWLALINKGQERSIKQCIYLNKRHLFFIATSLGAYLILYVLWRHNYPSRYEGLVISGFDLAGFAKVILTYSLSAFPFAALSFYSAPGDPAQLINYYTIVDRFNAASLVKPLVVGLLLSRVLTRISILQQASLLPFSLFPLSLGIFLPNILLGFTDRHQAWVNGGTFSYVYTYYSFIYLALFLTIFMIYLMHKVSKSGQRPRNLVILFFAIVFATLSYFVEVRNQALAFDQKMAYRKWELIDAIIDSGAFSNVPDGGVVVSQTLLKNRGYAYVSNQDWSKYIKYKTGKNVTFTDETCGYDKECFKLVFRQEPARDAQYIVFGQMERQSFGVKEFAISSIPALGNESTIFGSYIPNEAKPSITIDGNMVSNYGNGLFSFAYNSPGSKLKSSIVKISANADVLLESVLVSDIGFQPQLRSQLDELKDEILFNSNGYPNSVLRVYGLSGREQWGRWTDANIAPTARIVFKNKLPKTFSIKIKATAFGPNMNASAIVRVGKISKNIIVGENNLNEPLTLYFDQEDLSDTIEFVSSKPISPNQINPESRDSRKLGLGLISLSIYPE
jgi:hypothetical protein